MAQTWAYVQSIGSGTSGGYPDALALPSNVTVGNTIIVSFSHSYAGCAPSVSDNLGNTYTRQLNGGAGAGGIQIFFVYTAPVTTGGSCTVTVTAACGYAQSGKYVAEFSGIDNTNPYDTYYSELSSVSLSASTTLTTATNDELVLSHYFGSSPVTGTSGTQRYSVANVGKQDQNQGTAGTVTPTATTAGSGSIMWAAAFKQAAGGATFTATPQMHMMGLAGGII